MDWIVRSFFCISIVFSCASNSNAQVLLDWVVPWSCSVSANSNQNGGLTEQSCGSITIPDFPTNLGVLNGRTGRATGIWSITASLSKSENTTQSAVMQVEFLTSNGRMFAGVEGVQGGFTKGGSATDSGTYTTEIGFGLPSQNEPIVGNISVSMSVPTFGFDPFGERLNSMTGSGSSSGEIIVTYSIAPTANFEVPTGFICSPQNSNSDVCNPEPPEPDQVNVLFLVPQYDNPDKIEKDLRKFKKIFDTSVDIDSDLNTENIALSYNFGIIEPSLVSLFYEDYNGTNPGLKFFEFLAFLANYNELTTRISENLESTFARTVLNAKIETNEVNSIRALIQASLGEGNKVLIVPYSRAAIYTNLAYDGLSENERLNSSIVAIAPTVGRLADSVGTWVTEKDDIYITKIHAGSLGWNVDNIGGSIVNSFYLDFLGHSLNKSYLRDNSFTKTDTILKLKNAAKNFVQ